MKKLNNIWFSILMAFSFLVAFSSFYLADIERGYDSLGGEVFTLSLPILILNWWISSLETPKKEKEKV